jgi:S1-C subfamily serine protease
MTALSNRRRTTARRAIIVAAAIGGLLGPARLAPQAQGLARQAQGPAAASTRYTVPELARAMSPAVVFIGNVNRKGEVESIGSGFIVDPNGTIVTNYHVIEGASALQVKTLDGEIYDRVDVVDHDQRRDLAVIKIRAFKPLPTVTLSDESVEPGEDAVAIGNPKGLEHTISAGIVSAFRQAEGYRLIQISVPISPGSSGGPLFNLRGKVIGITSSGVVAEGAQNLNFAVPIDYVRPLLAAGATPIPIAEFSEKAGGVKRAARQAGRRGGSDELRAAWNVAHDHGDSFKSFCLGRLYLTGEKVGFANDVGVHNWEVPLAAVKEVAKNAFYASEMNAFHIRLVTNTNYNLVVVNDQLQFLAPDMLVFEIQKAVQEAR